MKITAIIVYLVAWSAYRVCGSPVAEFVFECYLPYLQHVFAFIRLQQQFPGHWWS